MANYDATTAAAQQASALKTYENGVDSFLRRRVIQFSDLATLKGSAVASGDTYDVLPIYAGENVNGVTLRVITVDGSASTATVGDQAGANYIGTAAALNSAAAVYGSSGTYVQAAASPYAVTGGKYYTAANTVRITIGGTVGTAAVFEVIASITPIGTLATV